MKRKNRDRLFVNSFEFILWGTKGSKWVFNRRFKTFETGYFECKNNGETEHPTEKQVETMLELITILSNEEGTVLDCFMGSGTTGVACLKLGRKFIGIEKDSTFFKMASERIKPHLEQQKLKVF